MKGLDTTTSFILLGIIAVALIALIITFIILLKKNKADKTVEIIDTKEPLKEELGSNTIGTTEPVEKIEETVNEAPAVEEKPAFESLDSIPQNNIVEDELPQAATNNEAPTFVISDEEQK